VHLEGSLSKDEGASIGETRGKGSRACEGRKGTRLVPLCVSGSGGINGTGHLEEASGGVNHLINLRRSTEGVDSVGKSIDGIRVVEGLGT